MYKFVCDLQSLLGYSPEELQAMVAQQQQQQSASTPSLEQSMQDGTSATPPMSQQSLKREVVDWFTLHGFSLLLVIKFNCWFYRNKSFEIIFLEYQYSEPNF